MASPTTSGISGSLIVALAAVLVGCADDGPPGACVAPGTANEFGAFNFTIDARPAAAQAELLASLEYGGAAFWHPALGPQAQPDAEGTLEAYLAQPQVTQCRLRMIAVLYAVDAEGDVDRGALGSALEAIARAGALPALMITSPHRRAGLERLAAIVRDAADMAARLNGGAGVTLVLYPHVGHPMDDAEAAMEVMQRAGRSNVKLFLHLCHELKAGNRDRLAEVIARVAPHLALASINGADEEREAEEADWSRTIRPLHKGDLDVEQLYLRPLVEAAYRGPVILHTYGLLEPPEDHYARSMARWLKMRAALAP
jgi:sugar phosphate isomerase/epimerase